MSAITITLACGCRVEWAETQAAAPYCATHQTAVVRAVKAPAPRFRGFCQGPSAAREALEPVRVPVPTREE